MNCALFAKMDQIFSLKNKTLKKYWKSQGILSVRKSGNPALVKTTGVVASCLVKTFGLIYDSA